MTARERFDLHAESCAECEANPIGCCEAGRELLRAAGVETREKQAQRVEKILSEPSERWK